MFIRLCKTEIKFLVVNFFESYDAVKEFAGPDYTLPVFELGVRLLLSRFDPVVSHYEVKLTNTVNA